MNVSSLLLTTGAMLAFVGQASATTILSDNFDAEHGGTTALNYAGFANFTVSGRVDLVHSGSYGLSGSGSFVDLAGSPGPGTLTTSQFFAFNAGDTITFSFDASGSQRRNASTIFSGFKFDKSLALSSFFTGGAYGVSNTGPIVVSGRGSGVFPVAANQPYDTYTIGFVAGEAGSFQAYLGTNDRGSAGPLADNVLIDLTRPTLTPEPATLALFGLGLAAIALGRRAR